MSRWTSTGNEISAGYRYIGYATNQQEATRIKDRHNAACDAYEARIDELERENAEHRRHADRHVPAGGGGAIYYTINQILKNEALCEEEFILASAYETAHDFAAKLINDLAIERDKLLHGECAQCEDKQRAIDALNAYVARLTDSTGTNLAYVERCLAEHRVEELTSDDFAGVYFQAQDVAREIGKIADGLAADLARVKSESLRVVKVDEACDLDDVPEKCLTVSFKGSVYLRESSGSVWWTAFSSSVLPQHLQSMILVQPVRLELWEASE